MKTDRLILYNNLYAVVNPEDYEAEIESLEGHYIEGLEETYGPFRHELEESYAHVDRISGTCYDIRTRQQLIIECEILCLDVMLHFSDIKRAIIDKQEARRQSSCWGFECGPYFLIDRLGHSWNVEAEVYEAYLELAWESETA